MHYVCLYIKGSACFQYAGYTSAIMAIPCEKGAKAIATEEISDEMRLKKVATVMGLGSSVDATNCRPWSKKSSYQPCYLQSEDVIVRDEGGNWQSYMRTVSSQREMKFELTASITAPNGVPVEIGADSELARSSSFSRKIYGRKLVDYVVSINPDKIQSTAEYSSFDERLSSWVVNRIRYHASTAKVIAKQFGVAVDKVRELKIDRDEARWRSIIKYLGITEAELKLAGEAAMYSEKDPANLADIDLELLVALCREFVRSFRVTHYVCSLQLGAAEYRVEEEGKETTNTKSGAKVDVAKFANLSASAHLAWEKFSTSMKTRRLGTFTEKGEVERMAVLNIEVLPITNLLKPSSADLRLALQTALFQYVEDHQSRVENQHLSESRTI